MSQAYTPKPFSLLEPIGREDIIANTGKEPQFTPREPGFLETLGKSKIDQEGFAAGLQDTLIPLLDRAYLAGGYHEQPGYSVDMTQWEKDRDYVDPDLRLNLLNARSSGEYNALLADARITTESRRILAERGYGGVVSSVAAQILAPENLLTLGLGSAAGSVRGVRAAATAFSAGTAITQAGLSDNITAMDALGGFAGDATFFLSMSKLGAANRGVKALAGGVSQAVPNALATAVQEDRGLAEVGAAAGMSFMLGGIFGASTPAPRTQAAAMHDKAVMDFGGRLVDIGNGTDITGKAPPLSAEKVDWAHTYVGHFDEQTLKEWRNPSGPVAVESLPKAKLPIEVDPSFSGTFRAGGENPASAAPLQNPYRRQDYKAGDIDGSRINIDAQGQTTLKLGKLDTKIPIALNPVNWITAGADNLARAYANIVGTNFVPRKDGTANYGVIAQRDDHVRSRRLVYTQALNSNYDTLQARQKAAGARVTPFHEFKSQVADAIESLDRPELLRQFDPEVVAMANKQADLQIEDVEFALRHRGEKAPKDLERNYLTHQWSRPAIDRLVKEVGAADAEAFIARSILKVLDNNEGKPVAAKPVPPVVSGPKRNEFGGLFGIGEKWTDTRLFGMDGNRIPGYVELSGISKAEDGTVLYKVTHYGRDGLPSRLDDKVLTESEFISTFGPPPSATRSMPTAPVEDIAAKNAKLAQRMAERLVKVGGKRGFVARLSGIDASELRGELEEVFGKIPDDDFKHLQSRLIQNPEDPNPRFRSRLPIDTFHTEEFNGKSYRIADLMERDADAAYARYAFRMASDAALAETRRVYQLKTGEELPRTHAEMQQWAIDRYGDNTNNAQRVIHIDRVLRGFPTEYINDTTFNRAAAKVSKVLRDGTHISVMGDPRAGVNQALEGAAIFANPELSLSFVNRVMPGMADVIVAFKRGEMPKHELMAHIMEARGTGLSSAVRNGGQRIDTNDASLRKLSAFEAKSQAVSHFMSKHISMEQPLTEATNAFAEMGVIGRFITEAEGDAASKLAPERLAALNLDEKMNNRILTEIRRHGQKNESGEIVHPRDMEWNDVDAAVAFREAVAIATKRVTNYRDQTTLGPWASTWWGKMLTQLQSYSLNAQGNIMQTQLGFADAGALKVIIAQSAMGMATLAVGALLAAPAQEDPEAYLERRLSAKNVALSSLGRAAWTGMMPRAYDVAAASMGFDPAFSQTRSAFISRDHGASSLAFNFAAQDTMISMLGSPGALLNALPGGDPFTDRDFDTLWKASMLPTTLQVHRAIRNALDLPERPN